MKKSFLCVLIVPLFITCNQGPTEDEIQAQIDEAVQAALSTTSTTKDSDNTTLEETTTTLETTTTTLGTTTTTQVSNPLITIDKCPTEVTGPKGYTIEYTIVARTSDVELLNVKSYSDGTLASDEYYTDKELQLPKKSYNASFITTFDKTSEFTRDYKIRVVYEVTNKAGLSFKESCTTNIKSKSSSSTSSSSSKSTKSFPPDPSSSTWVRFNGTGDKIIDISALSDELKVVHYEYSGGGNFIVWEYEDGGGSDVAGVLANEIGTSKGDVGMNFATKKIVRLEVSSYDNGNWELVIKPVAAARNFDSSQISGNGYELIEAYPFEYSSTVVKVTHSGENNFIIYEFDCNGEIVGILANEIGSYTGEKITTLGACFLEVVADGNWSISK